MVKTVSLSEKIQQGTAILKEGGIPNPRAEAQALLCFVLNADRIYLTIHANKPLTPDKKEKFDLCIQKRAAGVPFAYITGSKEFMSLEFLVSEAVLIPRPETELLVETLLADLKGQKIKILDLCTGSGAIACAAAKYLPQSSVTGIDISEEALRIAKKNTQRLNVEKPVTFLQADVLKPLSLKGKFDAVVSNPPYIRTEVIPTLERSVREYEPQLALCGGDDGLIFYRQIVNHIDSVLKKAGSLYFECGYDQAEQICEIMQKKFTAIHILKDYAGLNRVVHGQLV